MADEPTLSTLEPIDALRLAHNAFASRLAMVAEPQMIDQSACESWLVGDLIDHVIGGNLFTVAILNGATADAAMVAARQGAEAGSERRRAAYAESAREMLRLIRADGVMHQAYTHIDGPLSGREVVELRTEDVALHAWDLARSIGGDETLDPDLVRHVWRHMSPRAEELTASGQYGAGAVAGLPGDASLQTKLLIISGRS